MIVSSAIYRDLTRTINTQCTHHFFFLALALSTKSQMIQVVHFLVNHWMITFHCFVFLLFHCVDVFFWLQHFHPISIKVDINCVNETFAVQDVNKHITVRRKFNMICCVWYNFSRSLAEFAASMRNYNANEVMARASKRWKMKKERKKPKQVWCRLWFFMINYVQVVCVYYWHWAGKPSSFT